MTTSNEIYDGQRWVSHTDQEFRDMGYVKVRLSRRYARGSRFAWWTPSWALTKYPGRYRRA